MRKLFVLFVFLCWPLCGIAQYTLLKLDVNDQVINLDPGRGGFGAQPGVKLVLMVTDGEPTAHLLPNGEVLFNCSLVVVIIAVIPWGYTWRRYVTAPGNVWR